MIFENGLYLLVDILYSLIFYFISNRDYKILERTYNLYINQVLQYKISREDVLIPNWSYIKRTLIGVGNEINNHSIE